MLAVLRFQVKAGKMRYISDKLNGLEDFTGDKTSSAKEALDSRYGLSARAEAAQVSTTITATAAF